MSTRFSTSYLLVDGYNIIYAWKNLRTLADVSLEAARSKLVDILANYKGFKHQEIIVVFDAHRVEGGVGSVEHRNGIFIVYTREAETADAYIERTAGEIARENVRAHNSEIVHVRVATSDHLEQIIIMGQGAARLFADDFLREVEDVESTIRKRIGETKPIKKNQLIDNLDPETAAKFELMRLNKYL